MKGNWLVAAVAAAMVMAGPRAEAENVYGTQGEFRKEVLPEESSAARMADERTVQALHYDEEDAGGRLQPLSYAPGRAAEAFLDLEVASPTRGRIAEVEDIIIDRSGAPDRVVLASGGFFGLNERLLTIEYGELRGRLPGKGGQVSLPDASLRAAAPFSYRPDDDPATSSLTAGNVSVREVLDGHILDYAGERVAEVEDVVFADGEAQVIMKFREGFGVPGLLGAMPLRSLQRIDNEGEDSFQMTANQTRQFRDYK